MDFTLLFYRPLKEERLSFGLVLAVVHHQLIINVQLPSAASQSVKERCLDSRHDESKLPFTSDVRCEDRIHMHVEESSDEFSGKFVKLVSIVNRLADSPDIPTSC